ncbi:response regulator [Pelagicoccus mobilis]|uniref:Response regulator n=1 Tax=Pelagicoccus mobilis TaxID=415221 RepID=A0A934RZA2_9BACT|nr:response regulator [Pelagicoccus mobilis]MBK1877062.1 response regulator [Pelagicoccus mobilis]
MSEQGRILLVEDNPDDVELTLRAFKKQGLVNQIDVVNDGQDALDYLFRKGRFAGKVTSPLPSLVLLDLNLPRVDGIEVLKQIRSERKTRCVPVTILTTSREEEDLSMSYELGANSYIRKPVDFHQFTEAVKQLGFYWLLLNERPF